jgi:hypothetical protein
MDLHRISERAKFLFWVESRYLQVTSLKSTSMILLELGGGTYTVETRELYIVDTGSSLERERYTLA